MELADPCLNAETSGGLLLAVAKDRIEDLVAALRERRTPCAVVVGEVVPQGERAIDVSRGLLPPPPLLSFP